VFAEQDGHMSNLIKNGSALMLRSVPRLIHHPATVIVSIILLAPTTLAQLDSRSRELSANELARKVVTNELKFQDDDRSHWMYRLEKQESGKREVRKVVETKDGALSRLLYVDGQPLTAKEQQKENQRIQKLVSNPDEQRKLQQARNSDMEPGRRLLKMLPDAFAFIYAGRNGDLIRLSFRPNPNFVSPSREARVFHNMEGEMWIDEKQERLAALNGHLVDDVKFGGGLLGHLNKGGTFGVRQAEVAPGHWEMTMMNVDMKGKVLLFKTISVQQTENHSDFHRVPDELPMTQAVGILSQQVVLANNR